MKGYTKIELTNVHTGEKEVVEKHNIITNNLVEMYKTYLLCTRQSAYFNNTDPLYQNGMGGIILFSNPLTEDVNKFGVSLDSVDDITGCAGNFVNNTGDKKLGSRNINESKNIENGYKYVWDFGTSQANGTISAIGLTHNVATISSNSAYATPFVMEVFSASYPASYIYCYGLGNYTFSNIVSYDFDNNTFVAVNLISNTEIKFTVYKVDTVTQHILPSTIMRPGSKKILKLSETTVNLPIEININSGNILDGFDGYYYYVEHTNYSRLKLARISKTNFKYDSEYGLKDTTYDSSFIYALSSNDISIYDRIANGYLYIRVYSGSAHLHKIKLSDPTKYKDLTIPKYNSSYANMASNGKCIYTSGNIIFPDDSIVHYSRNSLNDASNTNYYFANTSTLGINANTVILVSSDTTKFVIINTSTSNANMDIGVGYFYNSLSTINNLSSSVVKTADKTMKITYTLTEGE